MTPQPARACARDVEVAASYAFVAFEYASDAIPPRFLPTIQRFAAALVACPSVKLEIAGHTDVSGAEERNFRLSWRRAEAVAVLLEGQGVQKSQFTIVGYGAREPAAGDRALPPDDATHRRVEFKLR
jgi:OmpA-OmpF porin, OOP family